MTFTNYSPVPLIPLIQDVFPEEFQPPEKSENPLLIRSLLHSSQISKESIQPYVSVLQTTIGEHYKAVDGEDWVKDKIEEMTDADLIYLSYCDPITNQIIGFISFMLTWDGDLIFYLYEIHVMPEWHGLGLGKLLIGKFHDLGQKLQLEVQHPQVDLREFNGFKLTVFSENEVYKWYMKVGYDYSTESPRDKKLRSGKIIKPDYYILYKPVQSLHGYRW